MLGSTFYHQTIRKYVAAFGTIFNDINVERKNSAGAVLERIKVPLAYGPRQKWILALQETTTDRRVVQTRHPRMGFALTGTTYDSTRKLRVQIIVRLVANSPSYSSLISAEFSIMGTSVLIPISGIVLIVTVNSGVK